MQSSVHQRSTFFTSTAIKANHASSETTAKKPCCSSSSASSSSSTNASSVHAAVALDSDEAPKKSCHSKSGAHSTATTKESDLPITSLQFWSDPSTWKVASTNTFRCLIGCTLGDMGMLFYLQSAHPTLSPGIAMAMAMTSGILTSITLETVVLRFARSSQMSWRSAFRTATGMSMISMLTMEAVENAVDWHLMGWGNVDIENPMFWRAIALSALAGWSAPLPFNYWNLKRHGKSCH
ncbi:hypothetical protein BGW38_003774 [Lunasporangiospora selenospora]|uniref:DUF4396 domain-containing protein n=1 Tax=Lunasporangiospora selenospora TaxID=979761 RepID=A0A9P6FQZ8_9FUNG|nr:hypothetical protein BGW38_003774 [Lunasporangiospora selenospora]